MYNGGYEAIRTLIKFYKIQDENIQERMVDSLLDNILKICEEKLNESIVSGTTPIRLEDRISYNSIPTANIKLSDSE